MRLTIKARLVRIGTKAPHLTFAVPGKEAPGSMEVDLSVDENWRRREATEVQRILALWGAKLGTLVEVTFAAPSDDSESEDVEQRARDVAEAQRLARLAP